MKVDRLFFKLSMVEFPKKFLTNVDICVRNKASFTFIKAKDRISINLTQNPHKSEYFKSNILPDFDMSKHNL